MFTKKEIEQLKKKLDNTFHNCIAELSMKTGLSRPTISRFLKFEKIQPTNEAKIYDACLELIEEQANKRKIRMKKIKELLIDDENTSQAPLHP